MMAIPRIDPKIKYVGTSKLREFNAVTLAALENIFVVQDNDKPLVVLLPYEWYLELQKAGKGELP